MFPDYLSVSYDFDLIFQFLCTTSTYIRPIIEAL